MDDMGRVFPMGAGQAVWLPEGVRFETENVRVVREGDRVVLEPAESDGEIETMTGLTTDEIRRMVAEADDESQDAEWNLEQTLREARAQFHAQKP